MNEFKWIAKLVRHHNMNRIAVYFERNAALTAQIKQIKGTRWSNSLKAWHLPDNIENRKKFKLPEKIIGKQNIYKINQANQKAIKLT